MFGSYQRQIEFFLFCFTTKWANKQINFKATESEKEIGKESWPMAVIFL